MFVLESSKETFEPHIVHVTSHTVDNLMRVTFSGLGVGGGLDDILARVLHWDFEVA